MIWKRLLVAGTLLFSSTPAWSDETVTYSYDALGRLVGVVREGTINNGIATSYSLDKASNRITVTTTGVSTAPAPAPVVRLTIPTAGTNFDEGQSFTIVLATENVAGKELLLRLYSANTAAGSADWTDSFSAAAVQAAKAAGCQVSTRQTAGYDSVAGFTTPGSGGANAVVIRFPPGSYNDSNPVTITRTVRVDNLTESAFEQVDFLIDRISGPADLSAPVKAVSKWIKDTSKSPT